MRLSLGKADVILIVLLGVLILGGALMFSSAAVGLLARGGSHISGVMFNHLVLGVGLGILGAIVMYTIDYRVWRTYAPYVFAAGLLGTALVFMPGIGFEHGGGRRWLDLGITTVQPSEFLKLAGVIMAASIFALLRDEAADWKGAAAFLALVATPGLLLAMQPDFGTLGIVTISIFSIAIAAGLRFRYIALLALAGVTLLVLLSFTPRYAYVYERIETFLFPHQQDERGQLFQVKQSLIAIGAGGAMGVGLGQSLQKFTYLPEPMGDSIFAVIAEELGFLGAIVVVGLFLLFAVRGYSIAARSPDLFGALLAVGISTYLVGEAFINIAAMLGLAPLTGIPLTFISQGGSAMVVSLASAGLLLNISRHVRKSA